jgi:hypothetical protein
LGPTPSTSLVLVGAWKSPSLLCASHNAGLYQNAVLVAVSSQSAGFSQQTPDRAPHFLPKGTRRKGTLKRTCSSTNEKADLEGNRLKATAVTVVWTRGFRVRQSYVLDDRADRPGCLPSLRRQEKTELEGVFYQMPRSPGMTFEPKCSCTEARTESRESTSRLP